MKVDVLLSRLKKVKQTSRDEWVACCSAHDDRSPSLAIKETSEGMVLIHCFAGCTPLEVLNAVGLDFHDVMPERVGDGQVLKRLYFNPRTVLDTVNQTAMLVALMANEVAKGEPMTEEDKAKFFELSEELNEATKLCQS